jgi:DNA-binding beta-propeller fold protein YncE
MTIARLMQMARAGVPAGGGDVWTDPDLANASYDSVSFSVATEDAAPRDLSFKPDGTKLYVLGIVADDVFEYDLSTAWDISTATYTASVSVGGASYGMYFRPDGEKFYIMDIGGIVYQWSLSSPWDVTTATYDSVSFSVVGQDTSPRDLAFKDDGTKMFIVGAYNDKIYQYSLSSAWDISTASYDVVDLSIVSQDLSPLGIVFNPSGTKFWIYGFTNQSIFEYSLSSAWDLSTASYSSISFSTTAQLSNGFGLAFSSGGDKMYVSANTGDTIYQYSTA